MENNYVIHGQEAIIVVDLIRSGEYYPPDDLKYSYKITNNQGVILQKEEDIFIAEDAKFKDRIYIVPSAETNTKDNQSVFEDRYINIYFYSSGYPKVFKKNYKLIDNYFYTACPEDVREVYGVNESELSDEQIDLLPTYIELTSKYGETLKNKFLSGDNESIKANRVLVLVKAYQMFNSLRFRVAESDKSGTNTFLRNVKSIDWQQLKQDIKDEYNALLEELLPEQFIDTGYDPAIFGSRNDPIVGEDTSGS